MKTIAIASDHAGVGLKTALIAHVQHLGYTVEDLGTNGSASVDYPDYADALAAWLLKHDGAQGILVCGSGVGISIAANRHRHVRAALCSEALSARLSRQHNNANVICLGARLIGEDAAKECVTQFLATEFEGGRHAARVNKLG